MKSRAEKRQLQALERRIARLRELKLNPPRIRIRIRMPNGSGPMYAKNHPNVRH